MTPEKRWLALFESRSESSLFTGIYENLVKRYAEPQRSYHNLNHVLNCLKAFDCVCDQIAHPLAVELVIWFHDAVYDTQSDKNNEASANLAVSELSKTGLPEQTLNRIYRLIMITKYPCSPETPDENCMADIDLSILGAPREDFASYEAAIQKEYKWVPADVFCRERAKLLESFLKQDRIFRTPYFNHRLEKPAKENIQTALNHHLKNHE